jgi:PEGA domain
MTNRETIGLLFVVCIGLPNCSLSGQSPKWVTDLVSELECGMTIEEVQRLTRREINFPGNSRFFLGSHYLSNTLGSIDIWLGLEQGHLRYVTLSKIDSLKTTRLSPRRDLCTGELSFLLRIVWTQDLTGSGVYLDGRKLEKDAYAGPVIIVPAGDHELRVEKDGFEPIVRLLRFSPNDRGDQKLNLSAEDLRPSEGEDPN